MTQTTTQTGSGSSTGQMTAVMRAMNQATGPKVLRVGVVQGGKVIEERIIKQRTHVTIGPSEKSMFVTANKNVPPSFRLFELVGDEYALNFLEGMAGRVALKTGVSDLASLKSQAKKVSFGQVQAFQVPLSDDARGKIVVGDTTFLFQFVAAPPPQPKPQLPASVRGGFVQSIDWTTTIIAAFSFLLHFGAVGTIYSDWMDPLVNDEVDVAQILETVRSLPPPPPVEQPKEADTTPTPASTAPAEAPKAAAGASAAKGAGGKISDTRAAAIANELNQLDMQMLGALNAAGNATAGVLDRGDVPLGLLDNAAASGAGAGLGGIAGLNLGAAGGGTVRPGAAGGG
ncbi:energy transducer TonB, partial [Polyangium sp. 6x1]|uniref:energy transducer TonB n=1 Tax=Polyangium sp. 6x1 TaxID=3042689 RepID=UPI0024828ECC